MVGAKSWVTKPLFGKRSADNPILRKRFTCLGDLLYTEGASKHANIIMFCWLERETCVQFYSLFNDKRDSRYVNLPFKYALQCSETYSGMKL